MAKKNKIMFVVAKETNPYWEKMKTGVVYTVLRQFWYNDEYHNLVCAPDGTTFEAPDVFFEDAKTS